MLTDYKRSRNLVDKMFVPSKSSIAQNITLASLEIADLLARKRKPHTEGEEIIKPALLIIHKALFGTKDLDLLGKVTLSADTVARRGGFLRVR